MNKFKFLAGFVFFSCASHSPACEASVNLEATVCTNCSYQEALAIAKDVATPDLSCSYANEVPDPSSEQCFSSEKSHIVFNVATNQSYKFKIYHDNQGFPSYSMGVVVTSESVDPEIERLLRIASEARGNLQGVIDQIPSQLVAQLTSTGLHQVLESDVFTTQTSTDCAQNPHARAVKDAVDSNARLNVLQYAANNSFVRGKSETVSWFKNKDGLSQFSLDSVTFGITSPSTKFGAVSVQGTFKVEPNSQRQFITRTYYPNPSHDSVTVGLTSTSSDFSKVVDVIDYSSGMPVATVSDNGTVIEGVVLRFILNTSTGSPLVVSKCVHEELKKALDIRAANQGSSSGAGESPSPGSGGGSSGGVPYCTYDVYTNGRRTGSYQALC